ncbi:MAG: DUF721 domain-containing protein [Ignavibacteriales bacterium]|nr:DUF721 domain-containing protein [Ignavibacteriales bacterium]
MPKYKSIAEVFQKEKEFKKFREILKENEILEAFGILFPDLKKIAKPIKIEKNNLFLRVENSVWRSELHLKQKMIIEKVNEHFNKIIIKSIKFVS